MNNKTHSKINKDLNGNDQSKGEVGYYIPIDVKDWDVELDKNKGYQITKAKQEKEDNKSKSLNIFHVSQDKDHSF